MIRNEENGREKKRKLTLTAGKEHGDANGKLAYKLYVYVSWSFPFYTVRENRLKIFAQSEQSSNSI